MKNALSVGLELATIVTMGLVLVYGVTLLWPRATMAVMSYQDTPSKLAGLEATVALRKESAVVPAENPDPSQLRIVTWNIRHGLDNTGRVGLSAIVDRLRQLNADIIGLQEVDRFKSRSGLRDQPKALARELQYQYAFGVNLRIGVGQYGNALLSRWPIIETSNYRLPGHAEPRGVLWALIKTPHGPLNVLVTHLGLSSSDRAHQLAEIQRMADGLTGPIVLIGDFNAREEASFTGLTELACGGGRGTYPATNPTACIDKVFVSTGVVSESTEAIEDFTSDHRPVVATLSGISVAERPSD